MTAVILDGAVIARQVYSKLGQRIAALNRRGVRPGLAAVEVGGNPASLLYISYIALACAAAGLYSDVCDPPANCTECRLLATLDRLNRNPLIHGIIVQSPLPPRLDA